MRHRSGVMDSAPHGTRGDKNALWAIAALAVALSACGGQAFSEEVPAESESSVALAEVGPDSIAAGSHAEGRWMAAAYVAERPEPTPAMDADAEVEHQGSARRPELTPRDPEPVDAPPVLVATDTDGRQTVDFEADVPSGSASNEIDADGYEGDDLQAGAFEDVPPATSTEQEADLPPLPEIAAGDEMVFAIEADLTTEDALPGDIFYATLVDDVVASDGMVLLPRGVRARGRVLESLASRDSEELPVLEITLEELIGAVADTPIEATVVDAEYIEEARDSDGESVVKVLTGAAAGAILGKILGGDDEDALKGGIAGAAAGAAIAYGTRGGHAKLPAGALITIRLDRPLVVP